MCSTRCSPGRGRSTGDDVAETLARIVEHEPDFDALPAATPTPIRRLLRRCLEKDRRKRLPDIGVARIEIRRCLLLVDGYWLASGARRLAWTVTAALAVAVIVGVLVYRAAPRQNRLRSFVHRFPSPAVSSSRSAARVRHLARRTRLVYRTVGGGPSQRQLNEAEFGDRGNRRCFEPFFSPDGRWLASSSGHALKKVSFAGGAVVHVATLPRNVGAQGYRGAAWSDDGTIAFTSSTGAGLFGVSERGGEPKPLTVIDGTANEGCHRWPHFLPGGRAILFTVKSTNLQSFDDAQIVVRSLDTESSIQWRRAIPPSTCQRGTSSSRAAGALYAVGFDTHGSPSQARPSRSPSGIITHPESGGSAGRDLPEGSAGLCGGRLQIR